MKLPFEVDAQGVPKMSLRWRLWAAWHVLLGHPVAFRVCIAGGIVAPAGHHVRVYGCKIDSGATCANFSQAS